MFAGVAGVVLLTVLTLLPDHRERAVQAYVLFLGGLAVLWLLTAAAAANPRYASTFDEARRPRSGRVDRLPELEKVEREVALSLGSAFDVHYRLRPLLRELAADRLAVRRGIDLDRDAEPARAALGDELWEVVRPDREPPVDRYGPGLPLDELRDAVAALERL